MNGDREFVESALAKQPNDTLFSSKETLFLQDLNNGVYTSGQLQFDLSGFANSGKLIDWSSAYLAIPFTIGVISEDGTNFALNTANVKQYLASLKNGSFQIIDSLQVKVNNIDMLNQINNLNGLVAYKLMSELSSNDIANLGPSINFVPDVGTSFISDSTLGITNTNAYAELGLVPLRTGAAATPAAAGNYTPSNTGLRKRLQANNYVAGQFPAGTYTAAQCVAEGKSYVTLTSATVQQFDMVAIVYLRHLSDLFKKWNMPSRKHYVTLTLRLNQGNVVMTTGVSGGNATATFAAPTLSSGSSLPICIESNIALSGVTGASRVAFGYGVSQATATYATTSTTFTNTITRNARCYVDAYTPTPMCEKLLLDAGPRKIMYEDYMLYTITAQAAGSTINWLVSGSTKNPQKLVIIPYVTNAQAVAPLSSPYLSPFDTAPATTSPVSLDRFQVYIGGQSIFNGEIDYGYDQFLQQTRPASKLFGGRFDGLSGDLIGMDAWQSLYRYYVFDLTRAKNIVKDEAKSIAIRCVNNSTWSVDLFCYIVSGQTAEFGLLDGSMRKLD